MQYLPNVDEQEWLLRELARIIEVRGLEAFVTSPIVLPTSEFFPDPVESVPATVDRVTRRLLQYAGLGNLEVRFEFFENWTVNEAGQDGRCPGIAGCFFGIEEGCCRFGIDLQVAQDAEQLAGVMAHEVAHAYRTHHGIREEDAVREEHLTDVTAAYLGFGVLAANVSYLFRKGGDVAGALASTWWSSFSGGYLPPQALSFLLGTQIAVRALDSGPRNAVLRELETNQAAFVNAVLAAYEDKAIPLAQALPLLPRLEWPRARTAADIQQPLPAFDSACFAVDAETAQQEKTVPAWNHGRPVFRMYESKRELYAMVDATLLGVLGWFISELLFRSWFAALPLAFVGLVRGARRGQRASFWFCSDAGCRVTLTSDLSRCPKCGGEIMGTLRHADERFALEDRFRNEARQRALGRWRDGMSPRSES